MDDMSDENKEITSKLRETARQAKTEFRPAVISAWFYTLVGIFFGFLLLAAQKGFELWSESVKTEHEIFAGILDFLAFMCEHLGIGLVVAAIAVFFYEWGAHIKKTMELSSKLTSSINQVGGIRNIVAGSEKIAGALDQTKKIMEALELTEKLYRDIDKATRFNLGRSLNSVIVGPAKEREEYLTKTAESCENLVRAIEKLRVDNLWGNNKYIEFITKQIDEFVGHNANAFSHLKLNHGTQKFRLPPTAAGMAAAILAHQMESMKDGDRYDVISDLTSWRDTQLDELFKKTEAAVTNDDVEVRRVFNFLPYIWRGGDKAPLHSYKNTLINHLDASETWKGKTGKGNYKIQILWPHGYDKLKQDHRVKNVNVAALHFGLFIHGNESVKFSVTKSDLSDMELCRQARDNDDAEIFAAIWAAAEGFPAGGSVEDRVNRIINELARQIGEV